MIIKRVCIFLSFSFFLGGCVSKTPIAESEWQQMIKAEHFEPEDTFSMAAKKVIDNRSPEKVLEASRKLLELSDGKDTQFVETPTSLSSVRDWYVWAVMVATNGYDYWYVGVGPNESNKENTDVQIALASESSTQIGGVSTGVGSGMMSLGGGGFSTNAKIYKNEAAYYVFWQRLLHLLGFDNEWITCREARDVVLKKKLKGSLSALCNMAADKTPDE